MPVLVYVASDGPEVCLLRGTDFPGFRQELFPVLRRVEVEEVLSDDLLGLVAKDVLHGRAGVREAPFRIDLTNPFVSGRSHLPEPFFAVPQRLLCPLALRDVADGNHSDTASSVRPLLRQNLRSKGCAILPQGNGFVRLLGG